jgi:LysM domain
MFVLNRDHFREIRMQQDQRIGLALGVLLIGASAAFFFRNETVDVSNSPRLKHAQELDDRIAERSTRPYLKGIEIVEGADRARTRTVADRQSEAEDIDEDHGRPFWSPNDSVGGKKSAGQRKPRASLAELDSDIEELDPIAIPGDHANPLDKTRKNETSTPNIDTGRTSDAATDEGSTYVVQKGETLSSIAAKRLGNSNRYRELYEANQDQLSDINDLKSGMTLRIPQARTESTSKSTQSKSRSVTDDPLDGIESARQNRRTLKPTTETPADGPRDGLTEPARKFLPSRRFLMPSRPQARNSELSGENTAG